MSDSRTSNKMLAQTSDIRKMGYLKKLKTNKRKYFLLRSETDAGPARLEYHDSEKKYKAGELAKRSITLRSCFNINKKSDSKHRFAIALYTKDDCFSVACQSEEEQEEWLALLLELQTDNVTEGEQPRPFFEHIWPVTVKPRGLGNGRSLSAGVYRLCLTNKTLSLIRLNQQDPAIVFQLASLRRCGHSDCFFFMEAGSSAVTGAGELWMQVEDTVIARNIHETILRNMAGDPPFRPRSRSTVSDRHPTKPIRVPPSSRGTSPGYDSSTLPPVRSKTISGDHPSSPTPPTRLRPGSKSSSGAGAGASRSSATSSSIGRGHSPVPTSPLSHTLSDSHRSRTDSMESRGSRGTVSSLSADELDLSPHGHHSSATSTRSVTPESAAIRDDPSYFSMTPMGTKESPLGSSGFHVGCSPQEEMMPVPYILVSPSSELGQQGAEYMEMNAGVTAGRESFTSQGESSYLDMARGSFSSSPVVSTASSGHDTDDHGYLDMVPVAHSLPTVQERITDGGYLDMSPVGSMSKGPPLPRPDRVQSYLSDDQSSACSEDLPKRAYSVGSKPTTKSKDNSSSYVDMTGKHANLDKANPKSSSAPHLVDKEKGYGGHEGGRYGGKESGALAGAGGGGGGSQGAVGRAAPYDKELLMEFDFFRKDNDLTPFRPRTSSAGREFRARTSSIGQEMRRRTGSFGRDGVVNSSSGGVAVPSAPAGVGCRTPPSGISRTASMGRHDRPRTSTICQDTFRTRTSSFGSTDMRPRSSSHGSRGYYKAKRAGGGGGGGGGGDTDSRGSSRHSSQESLRRTLQKASEDLSSSSSPSSSVPTSYMDMMIRRTPSPSVTGSGSMSSSAAAASAAAAARMSTEKAAALHKINTLWRDDEYLAMAPEGSTATAAPGGAVGDPVSYMDMSYEGEQTSSLRTRDSDGSTRRRPPDQAPTSAGKTSSSSGGGGGSGSSSGRPRSSTKPQQHRLSLRMPSTESVKGGGSSTTTSTAATTAGSLDTHKDDTDTMVTTPGEYIDISFGSRSAAGGQPPSPPSKQRSQEVEDDSRVAWSAQVDPYAVFAPGGAAALVSPSAASLEPVPCQLRLDDEDDEDTLSDSPIETTTPPVVAPAAAAARGGFPLAVEESYAVLGTPVSGASGSSGGGGGGGPVSRGGGGLAPILKSDPFSLLGSPPESDYMDLSYKKGGKDSSRGKVSSLDSTKSTKRTSDGVTSSSSAVSSSSSSSSSSGSCTTSSSGNVSTKTKRKSPVLPPKIRSREKTALPTSVSLDRTSPKSEKTLSPPKSAPPIPHHHHHHHSSSSSSSLLKSATFDDQSKTAAQGSNSAITPRADCMPPFQELVAPLPVTPVTPSVPASPKEAAAAASSSSAAAGTRIGGGGGTPRQLSPRRPARLSGSTSSLSSLDQQQQQQQTQGRAGPRVTMTPHGSTSSLTAMDQIRPAPPSSPAPSSAGGPRTPVISSQAGGGGGGPLLTGSLHPDYSVLGGDYENMGERGGAGGGGSRGSHYSSRTSVNSDKELNYASLDLASSMDETTFPASGQRSPLVGGGGKTAAAAAAAAASGEEAQGPTLSYAEIDFAKSSELRTATSLRERVPFNVK